MVDREGKVPAFDHEVEHNGVLCLNRSFAEGGVREVIASCEVAVPQSGKAILGMGYSDAASVWVEDRLVHEGEWIWDPATARDGRIMSSQVVIPIEAAPGWRRVTVRLAKAEPPFGWGFVMSATSDGKPLASRSSPG